MKQENREKRTRESQQDFPRCRGVSVNIVDEISYVRIVRLKNRVLFGKRDMTDPCDNPRYDQKIGYDKLTDTYEIYDDYGESTISIREMKKLLKCVKQTHPELLVISAPRRKE